jgi:hypothetical protein
MRCPWPARRGIAQAIFLSSTDKGTEGQSVWRYQENGRLFRTFFFNTTYRNHINKGALL